MNHRLKIQQNPICYFFRRTFWISCSWNYTATSKSTSTISNSLQGYKPYWLNRVHERDAVNGNGSSEFLVDWQTLWNVWHANSFCRLHFWIFRNDKGILVKDCLKWTEANNAKCGCIEPKELFTGEMVGHILDQVWIDYHALSKRNFDVHVC